MAADQVEAMELQDLVRKSPGRAKPSHRRTGGELGPLSAVGRVCLSLAGVGWRASLAKQGPVWRFRSRGILGNLLKLNLIRLCRFEDFLCEAWPAW